MLNLKIKRFCNFWEMQISSENLVAAAVAVIAHTPNQSTNCKNNLTKISDNNSSNNSPDKKGMQLNVYLSTPTFGQTQSRPDILKRTL